MKKKGFTLIELLGVIVILAVVALVATPIILNIVDDARKQAAITEMTNIKSAVQTYYYNKTAEDLFFDGTTFICENNSCSNGIESLDFEGQIPESGTITIDNKGNIAMDLMIVNNHYCYPEGETFNCNKFEAMNIENNNNLIINDNITQNLIDYKIYGNSVQNGTPSVDDPVEIISLGNAPKNLVNIPDIEVSSPNVTVNCNLTKTFVVSSQVYPTSIADSDGVAKNVWRIQYKYLNGNVGYIQDSALKMGMVSISATEENPVVSITTRSIYIKEGKYGNIQIEYGQASTDYEPYRENGYIVPITVTGKNLFNKDSVGCIDCIWSNERYSSGTSYTGWYPSGLISVIPDETYVMSGKTVKAYNYVSLFNKDKEYVNKVLWKTGESYTIPDDVYYIGVSVHRNDLDTFQIEKGDTATGYEAYMGKTYNIYLDEPLRKVGGAADYIDFEKGVVVRKVKKLVLNGTEEYNYYGTNVSSFTTVNNLHADPNYREHSLSNYFNYKLGITTEDCFWTDSDGVSLRITNLSVTSIEDFKTWLASNNVELYYAMETPIETPIEIPKIELNSNTKSISINTNIYPSNVQIKYYKKA